MKINKKDYVLPLLSMLITWPIFGAWITLFRRQWFMMPFGVMVCILLNSSFFRTKRFSISIIYFAIICIYFLLGVTYFDDWPQIIIEGCMLIFIGAMATSILSEGNDQIYHFITVFSVVMLVITSIASYYFNLTFPEIIRMIGHATPEVEALQLRCQKYGMAGYSLPHAIPIVIPAFVVWYRNAAEPKYRILAIICIILTVVLALASGATTPFLLAIMIAVISLMIKKGTVKQNISRFIILTVISLVLVNQNIQLMLFSGLDFLAGDSESIHLRILELQNSILYEESSGDLEIRSNLYTKSIETFFSHPLFGSLDTTTIGGHATLLDRLGVYGLLGFVPYFAFLISQFKFNLRFIVEGYESYYIVSLIACLIMMGSKNFDGWYQWCLLMVIAPAMINEFAGHKQKTNPIL